MSDEQRWMFSGSVWEKTSSPTKGLSLAEMRLRLPDTTQFIPSARATAIELLAKLDAEKAGAPLSERRWALDNLEATYTEVEPCADKSFYRDVEALRQCAAGKWAATPDARRILAEIDGAEANKIEPWLECPKCKGSAGTVKKLAFVGETERVVAAGALTLVGWLRCPACEVRHKRGVSLPVITDRPPGEERVIPANELPRQEAWSKVALNSVGSGKNNPLYQAVTNAPLEGEFFSGSGWFVMPSVPFDQYAHLRVKRRTLRNRELYGAWLGEQRAEHGCRGVNDGTGYYTENAKVNTREFWSRGQQTWQHDVTILDDSVLTRPAVIGCIITDEAERRAKALGLTGGAFKRFVRAAEENA